MVGYTGPRPTKGMSGASYVPMRLQDTSDNPEPIKIRDERSCEHCETVCSKCAFMWEQDWVVLYDRTIGGRSLQSRKMPPHWPV